MSLSNEKVVELSKSFVAASWSTDLDNARISAMEVVEIPALLFFTPSGTYVHRVPPMQRLSAAGVASAMRYALVYSRLSTRREKALRARTESGAPSVEALDALAQFYRKGYRFGDARESELLALRSAAAKGSPGQDRRMAELLYLDLKLRQFGRARETARAFMARYPDSAHRERVEYYRGLRLFHGPKKLDQAVKTWEEQLGRYPKGAWAHKARTMLRRARAEQRDRKKFRKELPEVWRQRPEADDPQDPEQRPERRPQDPEKRD